MSPMKGRLLVVWEHGTVTRVIQSFKIVGFERAFRIIRLANRYVQGLPYVINMTLPDKSEDYIHRIGRVGRADTMGLAISLVSAKPEKVWYCSKKGYKPWFNPSKEDTKQHAIWYDEKALLKDIEARIKHPVAPLGKDLALPAAGPVPNHIRSFTRLV